MNQTNFRLVPAQRLYNVQMIEFDKRPTVDEMVDYILNGCQKKEVSGEIILRFKNYSTGEEFYRALTYKNNRIALDHEDTLKRLGQAPIIAGYKTQEMQVGSGQMKDVWHIQSLDIQKHIFVYGE